MKNITVAIIVCILSIIIVGFSYASMHRRDKMEDVSDKEITVSEQQKYEELENRLRKLELDLYMQGQALKRISEKLERGNN